MKGFNVRGSYNRLNVPFFTCEPHPQLPVLDLLVPRVVCLTPLYEPSFWRRVCGVDVSRIPRHKLLQMPEDDALPGIVATIRGVEDSVLKAAGILAFNGDSDSSLMWSSCVNRHTSNSTSSNSSMQIMTPSPSGGAAEVEYVRGHEVRAVNLA